MIFSENFLKLLVMYAFVYSCIFQLQIGVFCLSIILIEELSFSNPLYYTIAYYFCIFFPCITYTIFSHIIKTHKKNISETSLRQKRSRFACKIFGTLEILFITITLIFIKLFNSGIIQFESTKYNLYTYSTIPIISFIFTLFVLIFSYILTKNFEYTEIIRINQKLMVEQNIYFENQIKNVETMRKLKHDLNHHIVILESLIQNNECEKAEKYLNTLQEKLPFQSPTYFCNNLILDSILSVYEQRFLENNIILNISGTFPCDITINDFDLCTIFSNLLLNAIEACIKVKDKNNRKIFIFINSYGSYVNLVMKNTYSEIKSNFRTSKKDYLNHGFGLKNIRDSVENNNGNIEISYDNEFFCVNILLQSN